jgi:hypothetical protein
MPFQAWNKAPPFSPAPFTVSICKCWNHSVTDSTPPLQIPELPNNITNRNRRHGQTSMTSQSWHNPGCFYQRASCPQPTWTELSNCHSFVWEHTSSSAMEMQHCFTSIGHTLFLPTARLFSAENFIKVLKRHVRSVYCFLKKKGVYTVTKLAAICWRVVCRNEMWYVQWLQGQYYCTHHLVPTTNGMNTGQGQ